MNVSWSNYRTLYMMTLILVMALVAYLSGSISLDTLFIVAAVIYSANFIGQTLKGVMFMIQYQR